MPQGLEVYNANGTIRNGITNYLGRVLGQQTVSGTGTIAWPYPGVGGGRVVHVVSQFTPGPNVISTAWAFIDRSTGLVNYSQADDAYPIILLFMAY